MNKFAIAGAALALMSTSAFAQVELKTYADKNGDIDVQKLTCAQFAGTFQEDADFVAVWYSGWYNGLAKSHLMHIETVKDVEQRVILYCKDHPDKTVIKAIAAIQTEMRKERGIKLK